VENKELNCLASLINYGHKIGMLVEFVSLEIISWNLSGLDDCRKRKRVREIISIASLTIVKLQETKLESFDALQDIRDLRFKDYGSSCLL